MPGGLGFARPGSDEWLAIEQARKRGTEGPSAGGGGPIGRPPTRTGRWVWDRATQQWVVPAGAGGGGGGAHDNEISEIGRRGIAYSGKGQQAAPTWGPSMPGSGDVNTQEDNDARQAAAKAAMDTQLMNALAMDALRRRDEEENWARARQEQEEVMARDAAANRAGPDREAERDAWARAQELAKMRRGQAGGVIPGGGVQFGRPPGPGRGRPGGSGLIGPAMTALRQRG